MTKTVILLFVLRRKRMGETTYKTQLVNKLRDRFPGAVIIKTNPSNQLSGFPDLLILYKSRWAALETKKSSKDRQGQNQIWWAIELNKMSFASFIYPEVEREVLNELQRALKPCR